jgi:hypothetical protein
VNGSNCSSNPYINEPCVSVTVCSPDNSACQTIKGILLDTGDIGLRLFKQVLKVPLTPVTNGTDTIAECVQYADGSLNWGPVETANVILGNEATVQPIPIQVIDSNFAAGQTVCQNPNRDPGSSGFNGSLGVGFYLQDCGSACASSTGLGQYYSCGSGCVETTVAVNNQVQNPVALLPHDNNGVVVELPSLPSSGAFSANGALVLGIGTQPNNTPSGVNTYDVDQFGDFTTLFNGFHYGGFIDSGSNGLFFTPSPPSLLPICHSDWYCPSSTKTFTATNIGASGSPSGSVSFNIANFDSLLNSSNNVSADIGGPVGPTPDLFDWGLPFFFGRKVYIGVENRISGLGTGPYWAY